MALALVLTMSRSGAMGLVVALTVSGWFVTRRQSGGVKRATVVAYLLVAVLFGQLYEVVLELNPQSFNIAAVADRPPQLVQSDLLYFLRHPQPRSGMATCCLSPRPLDRLPSSRQSSDSSMSP